ncbi:unnamed protein product [Closterium sp. NIES-53]
MIDDQLAAGDNTLNELDDFIVDELLDGALSELPCEPAAKKQCGEGMASDGSRGSTTVEAPAAPPPVQCSNSSGSSAASNPSSSRPKAPPRPRYASVLCPPPPIQEAVADPALAGSSSGMALTARYRNLRRHRPRVEAELRSLTRDTQALVALIFSES